MSSQYERELRQVLAGVPKGVEAVIRSCNPLEKQKMRQVLQRPFLVVRAAGSGMEGTGDLLALRGDLCFPIEVKSTRAKKLYLSGRTKLQYEAMVTEGERCNLMPLYAHRQKGIRGDSWRIFRVETNNLSGRLRQLEKSIPLFPTTRNGSVYLNWEDGMPLHAFVALVCSSAGAETHALHNLEVRTLRTNLFAKPLPSTELEEFLPAQTLPDKPLDVLAELARRRS
ncbi:MAG: Holliday junction resolvase [Candidatus Poseidoniaceae archaeon]